MKTISAAIVLGLLWLPIHAQQPVASPKPLQDLRAAYEKEAERVMAPINDKYVAALNRLKDSFTREAKLAEALLVENEIKRITKSGDPVSLPPVPATVKITSNELEKQVLGVWIVSEATADGSVKKTVVQVYPGNRGNYGGISVSWRIERKQLVFADIRDRKKESTFRFDDALENFTGVSFDGTAITGTRRK